ncbi:Uncharacterised protein [Mycobacteroides abscessus subsp. abscessus]|nr:Uncharacterised protein [Mycobacteroides abscessus subsp. abscessus]
MVAAAARMSPLAAIVMRLTIGIAFWNSATVTVWMIWPTHSGC